MHDELYDECHFRSNNESRRLVEVVGILAGVDTSIRPTAGGEKIDNVQQRECCIMSYMMYDIPSARGAKKLELCVYFYYLRQGGYVCLFVGLFVCLLLATLRKKNH